MRFLYAALFGLALGASSLLSPTNAASSAASTAVNPQLDSLFSSDAADSLHEANNQGTLDEPAKPWAEANTWLHASLTETEREFLTLVVTGTVQPNIPANGGLQQCQVTDTAATITVSMRFNLPSFTQSIATALQSDIVTASGGLSTVNSVSVPTFNSFQVSKNAAGVAYFETNVQFTISYNSVGSIPAGQQFVALTTGFASSASTLRATSSFQNVDLSIYPQAVVTGATSCAATTPPTLGPSQTAAPTVPPTLPPTTSASYCATHNTACLSGGTCIDGIAPAYSCSCPQGYIGSNCQYSLNFNSKRRGKNGIARGRSITRPNSQAAKVKSL